MILVLGGTGFVGRKIGQVLQARGWPQRTLRRAEADYTTRAGLRKALGEFRPDFVICAAGYTGKPNVDAAEREKADCLLGNAVLPGLLREECGAAGVAWGQVSSGCIFSGRRADGEGFTEEDAPNFSFRRQPCSFYSGTKALGEEALGWGESHDGWRWEHPGQPEGYVWRLRIPFDEVDGARNYLSKLMRYTRLLEAENSISHLGDFAGACLDCWERRAPFGIYNVTNPGSVTTHRVVELIEASPVGARLRAAGKTYTFFRDEADFMAAPGRAPRSNCVLDASKLARAGIRLRPVEEAIQEALDRWVWES